MTAIRLSRMIAAALLAMTLAVLPGLIGCGGNDTSSAVFLVKYGLLWDFTGRASSAMVETYEGLRDYIVQSSYESPIPGAELKLVTYDTKSDASRVTQGYLWLKGQGATVIAANPQDAEILRQDFETDQVPFLDATNLLSTIDSEWLFSLYGPAEGEMEAVMQWIMDTWPDYPTKPKVGYIGFAGIPYYESQRSQAEAVAELFPDSYDWTGADMVPYTTTSWAGEVGRIIENDFTIVGMSGSPLVSFTKEARERGYEGRLAGPMASYMTFWKLLKDSVPLEYLDGVTCASYYPWWDDDVPFVSGMKQNCEEVLSASDRETVYLGTGRMGGWAMGMIIVDAVRRAAETVGPDAIDCTVMQEMLAETDMDMVAQGWGNEWKLEGDVNCFAKTVRIYEYDATSGSWEYASDKWYTPACLGG